ncbi:MAG: hypothetical protein JNJ65_01735 [Cyclobacteriaceae bacterium]|nr:hypothetical protein [Cyclobacteriaceae bacterium]
MKIIFLFLLLITNLGLSQSIKLSLDGTEWSDAVEYPVQGRQGILINQKLSFGEYHTLLVDRSWTKGSSSMMGLSQGLPTDQDFKKIITSEKVKKNQTLYFALADSLGNQARAYCITNFKSKDFTIGDNPNSVINLFGDILGIGDESSSTFYAMIYDAQATNRWELLIDNQEAQLNPKEYKGYLSKSKDEFYTIKPLSKVISKKGKVGTMPFGSAGFEIRNSNGVAIAAVSMIDKGVVYLTKVSPEERILLSGVCAALLLQEQI